MISIVCVYNDVKTLESVLLRSLEREWAEYELILVDNRDGVHKGAAEALNCGGKQANGKYIMFVHQDIEFQSVSCLGDIETILDRLPDLGVAGIAGMSTSGRSYSERVKAFTFLSNPIPQVEEVQTLDECLMIVPNSVFQQLKFDEQRFDGWHCYGADYCLCAGKMGLKTYVLPISALHCSTGAIVGNLFRYQRMLYSKHRKHYKEIYLTMSPRKLSPLSLYLNEHVGHLYLRLFPTWTSIRTSILERELSGCHTLLDLGCSNLSWMRWRPSYSVGVGPGGVILRESKRRHIHNECVIADVRSVQFKQRSFDAVIALNNLSELTREERYDLVARMAYWSKKRIAVCISNAESQPVWHSGNCGDQRQCVLGWSVEELNNMGFKVFGINGWKQLSQWDGSIKYKPTVVWQVISNVSQKITRYYPELASILLAVKAVD
jgi:hypothetical protein